MYIVRGAHSHTAARLAPSISTHFPFMCALLAIFRFYLQILCLLLGRLTTDFKIEAEGRTAERERERDRERERH